MSRLLASQIFSCILTSPLNGWVQMVQRYDENGLIFIYIDAFIIFKVKDLFSQIYFVFSTFFELIISHFIFPLIGRVFLSWCWLVGNLIFIMEFPICFPLIFFSFHVHELLYLIWWYFLKRGLYFGHSFPWNIINVFRQCLDFHKWMEIMTLYNPKNTSTPLCIKAQSRKNTTLKN